MFKFSTALGTVQTWNLLHKMKYNIELIFQLPFLRMMEDPNVYDIDKDFGTPPEVDKLGGWN